MPEKITFHLSELIAALSFILGGGGIGALVAKQKGWITFGKPVERRNCPGEVSKICQEHNQMIVNVSNMQSDLAALNLAFNKNTKVMSDMHSSIDKLVGYFIAKNGVDLGRR